jgi:hypothetical protein
LGCSQGKVLAAPCQGCGAPTGCIPFNPIERKFYRVFCFKATMTELELKVRTILYNEWNPCGIGGLPEDEYDTYVPWVSALVASNDPNIAVFLAVLQDHYFCGLGKDEKTLKLIVNELRKLNP